MKQKEKIAGLEQELQSCQRAQSVSRGYRRVFFLTLAVAILLQAFSFFYIQTDKISSVLSKDFKIILTLNKVTAQRVNEIGELLSSNNDVSTLKFISAEDGFSIIASQNPQLADNFVFLGRKPMTEYFELTLNPEAFAGVEKWVQENIEDPMPDVKVHYKPQAAKAAAYAALLIKFLNIMAALFLAVFFSFVFFVEGHSTKVTENRLGAAVIGLLSYGISLGAFYGLLIPLKNTESGFFTFTIIEVQCVLALLCVILGWSLGKWKRF
ncbi:hypothetical protein Dip510_000985 [Elusimicrobium posterum]|uniref:hypothetical protein n=1 Tax=Elusimicrobium posterum TaxID=3116653 RepID=UPI003C7691F7